MNPSGKDIKAIRLVRLLSKTEVAAFGRLLAGQKRKTLQALFSFIVKRIKHSAISLDEKAALFKAVFGRVYTKREDYLLRNELRLLAHELTGFISLEKIRNVMQQQVASGSFYFLQSVLERKDYALFESEYPKLLKDALLESDFETAAKIIRLLIDDLVFRKEATQANYEQLLSLTAQYYDYAGSAFLHDHIYVRHKQAFAERTLHAILEGFTINPLEPITFNWPVKPGDSYLEYMRLLTVSYSVHGAEKISVLKAAQALIGKISKNGFDRKAALATTSAGMGLEYFLSGDYRQALFYHKKSLENASALSAERIIAFVFNNLSALTRLEKYPEAIRMIEKYRSTWGRIPRVRDRFLCLKAMSHIFLNDHDAAWECIPLDRKQSGIDHYYYYRVIQIIVYHLRGEPELAMNETENFEHTVRYQDKDEHYLRLIVLMKKFLRLHGEKPALTKADYFARKARQREEINLEQIEKQLPDKMLLYRWIAHALK